MKKVFNILYVIPLFATFACNAATLAPDIAIANARVNCGGISEQFKSMKTMAQVNTAITGVGTAAGAGAVAVGIAKASTDSEIEKLIRDTKQRESTEERSVDTQITQTENFVDAVTAALPETSVTDTEGNKLKQLEQKSKNLGNWRTGLLAGNTATNIAATVIAANNHTNNSLREQLNKCVESIRDLQDSKMQAQINNADTATIQRMNNIITACREYDTLDVSKIDTKATGAAISSGAGIAVGTAGTVTSALANTDKIRNDNSNAGMSKEKNLNTASNVLAAGATVASGVATVFNAQQIGTINRAQQIATKCSEALNQ